MPEMRDAHERLQVRRQEEAATVSEEAIEFVASLPPIQSAITLDGNGDGARIKLDIPRSHVGAALLLQHKYSGRAFKVTIEPLPKN